MRNSKIRSDNTSGIKGVSKLSSGKWHTKISVHGKVFHLGNNDDFDEIVCLRLAVEQCLGWHGCDSTSPSFIYVKENIQKELLCNML